jgi:hypothetical protein
VVDVYGGARRILGHRKEVFDMGLLSQKLVSRVEGHVVEVEAVDTSLQNRFSLIIDNKRVDQQSTLIGGVTLRGLLEELGQPITVSITSGILVSRLVPFPIGTYYSLSVAGKRHPFE